MPHGEGAAGALIPLQKLQSMDLETYLGSLRFAPATVGLHHAILHLALRKAVKHKLLTANPATDLEYRRPPKDLSADVRQHCWSAFEAKRFLDVAATASPQTFAFMALALDSGGRKSELAGLGWQHLDLDAGTLFIERQLEQPGSPTMFGPTKTGRSRSFHLGQETLSALRVHKAHQAELKMANRTTYRDLGLIFAREPEDCQTPGAKFGDPIRTLGETRFQRLIEQAGVKKIKFHGLRHTSATIDLQAGTRPKVVAERLGHSVVMLMTVYEHALPGHQQEAAARRAAALHGR